MATEIKGRLKGWPKTKSPLHRLVVTSPPLEPKPPMMKSWNDTNLVPFFPSGRLGHFRGVHWRNKKRTDAMNILLILPP